MSLLQSTQHVFTLVSTVCLYSRQHGMSLLQSTRHVFTSVITACLYSSHHGMSLLQSTRHVFTPVNTACLYSSHHGMSLLQSSQHVFTPVITDNVEINCISNVHIVSSTVAADIRKTFADDAEFPCCICEQLLQRKQVNPFKFSDRKFCFENYKDRSLNIYQSVLISERPCIIRSMMFGCFFSVELTT